MRLHGFLSLLVLILQPSFAFRTITVPTPEISITITIKYLTTTSAALPTSNGNLDGVDGEFHPDKVNLAARFARPWGGALFKITNPCSLSYPPSYLRTQSLVAFLPLPVSSDCTTLTALRLLQTTHTLDGIILYIPISSGVSINDISETDIDTVEVPILVLSTEVGSRVAAGLDGLDEKSAPEGVGQTSAVELEDYQRRFMGGGLRPSIPVPLAGYPYDVGPSHGSWGTKKVKRQAGSEGEGGHWIGYVDVVPVRTTLVPYNQDMDVGLLWQFGLALIAGVLFFGIPCTCLISWFARRRLEQHIVELEDLEIGHNQPDTDSPIVPDHVMNEADLKMFPVKKYRKKGDGVVEIQDGDVEVAGGDQKEVAPAADGCWGHDGFQSEGERRLEEGLSSVTLLTEDEMDVTDVPRERPSSGAATKPKRPESTHSSLSTVTNYTIDTCAVCLDVFEDGCTLRELRPCKHYFHKECIELWVTRRNGVCPICRVDLLQPEASPGTQNSEAPSDPSPTPHLHCPNEGLPAGDPSHAEEPRPEPTSDTIVSSADVLSEQPHTGEPITTADNSAILDNDDKHSESGADENAGRNDGDAVTLPHQPEGR